MPDWMATWADASQESVLTLVVRLAVAGGCGWIISFIARQNRPAATVDTLSLTLVLMSILIAMATQIIGDNIARAFSLVGALSIVRFRTAVPETRDVAFVLAAVVVGMAVGADQYWVSGIGLIAIGLAAQWMPAPTRSGIEALSSSNTWRLTLRVGLHNDGGWETELNRMTESYKLISAETTRRGGALELVYDYQPREGWDVGKLVASLNAIPTVEFASAKPSALFRVTGE
jgi:Domain of unknown function (DUF4956)